MIGPQNKNLQKTCMVYYSFVHFMYGVEIHIRRLEDMLANNRHRFLKKRRRRSLNNRHICNLWNVPTIFKAPPLWFAFSYLFCSFVFGLAICFLSFPWGIFNYPLQYDYLKQCESWALDASISRAQAVRCLAALYNCKNICTILVCFAPLNLEHFKLLENVSFSSRKVAEEFRCFDSLTLP